MHVLGADWALAVQSRKTTRTLVQWTGRRTFLILLTYQVQIQAVRGV